MEAGPRQGGDEGVVRQEHRRGRDTAHQRNRVLSGAVQLVLEQAEDGGHRRGRSLGGEEGEGVEVGLRRRLLGEAVVLEVVQDLFGFRRRPVHREAAPALLVVMRWGGAVERDLGHPIGCTLGGQRADSGSKCRLRCAGLSGVQANNQCTCVIYYWYGSLTCDKYRCAYIHMYMYINTYCIYSRLFSLFS